MPFLSLLVALAAAQEVDVYWGAIHEHSALSRAPYGFTPQDAYANMITRADLDFGAVVDYDWALSRGTWPEALTGADAMHCPDGASGCYADVIGEPGFEALAALGDRPFVTLGGYEWNNQSYPTAAEPDRPEYGHRNVYFLNPADPEGPYPDDTPLVVSGEGAPTDGEGWGAYFSPCDLWTDLAASGLEFITIPHHVALSVSGEEGVEETGREKPAATDWSVHPQACGIAGVDYERIEPAVEIYSVWGNNEHAAMPLEEDPVDGLADPDRVVREAALTGPTPHRLGFVGAGDTHTGFPGEDPPHSFLLDPAGEFRNYTFDCALDADCVLRFGRTGLLAALVPAGEGLTRANVFEAIQSRHTIATTGERLLLTATLTVDGEPAGIQGDGVEAEFSDGVRLAVAADAGDFEVARLSVWLAGDDGAWVEQTLDLTGGNLAGGDLDLFADGVAADWLPAGALTLYARLEAAPVGSIVVPAGAAPLSVEEEDGGAYSVSITPGRYTAPELLAELERAWGGGGLEYLFTYDQDAAAPLRFEIRAATAAGAPVGLRLGFAASPDIAYALGFRDDADAPADGGWCAPCLADVPVAGEVVTEMAWASPMWLDLAQIPPTGGDSGVPPGGGDSEGEGKGCGCGGGAAPVGLWWLVLIGWQRRR